MAKLAIDTMQNGRANYIACKRELSALNASGGNYDIPPNKHVVYCDTTVHFCKRLKTYTVNFCNINIPIYK
ncbi:MAG: hypothetical protein IJ301_00530 [Clostridia bacterium]|nr:hypothetical protein [Clostridia bacterium]